VSNPTELGDGILNRMQTFSRGARKFNVTTPHCPTLQPALQIRSWGASRVGKTALRHRQKSLALVSISQFSAER